MAFDGIVISALCKECEEKLKGARIDKIHQPEKDELIISLRTFKGAEKLLICVNPSFPRFHLTNVSKDNPEKPPMFCMLLRKHLSGGKILYIKQSEFERIVKIGIECYDEMGFLSEKVLIVEIMGKHSNIILTNKEGKILDSIIHVDLSVSSIRQVLPSFPYEEPPKQDKENPVGKSKDEILNVLKSQDAPVWKILMEKFQGISPVFAREAVYRAIGHTEVLSSETDDKELSDVSLNFYSMMEDIRLGEYKYVVINDTETGKMLDFCALDISQYGTGAKSETFASMSEAVENFYVKKATRESLKQKCADISKTVASNLDRCRKKLQIQNETLIKAEKREKYKIYADLITANIYRIKQGDEKVSLVNFYSENGEEITINLKPELSPSKNAQAYYKKYNKEKKAEEETLRQKELNLAEIDYLESVQEAISLVETNAEIIQIRDELIEEGYLKNKGRLLKKKKKESVSPMHFVSDDGYDIYVGKNNKQNDYVTLKLARSTDLWFHTKGIHGSHVIVKTDDAMKVSDETYLLAARLSAYYSKGRKSESVAVDYTEVKNVKKPSGAKPGMVIYANYNTLYVTPDEIEIERLKKA